MRRSVVSRALAGVAVVMVSGSLVACDVPGFSSPSVAEGYKNIASRNTSNLSTMALLKEDTLTVGLRKTSMPPLIITGDDGNVSGMDVDIAAACAQQMGLKVAYVSVDDVATSLGSTCDVVMGVNANEAHNFTVMGDYAETATAFFHKGAAGVCQSQDLMSKKVGYQARSVSQTALEATGLSMQGTGYTNLNEVFDALEAGQIDFAVCSAYSGSFIARNYDDINLVGTLDAPVATGVAVSSQNVQLGNAVKQALDTVQTNGVGDIVHTHWVGNTAQLTTADQVQAIPQATEDQDGESVEGETSGSNPGVGSNAVTSV